MEHGRYVYEHVFDTAGETGADESSSVWWCPHSTDDGSVRCLSYRLVEETRLTAVTEALREVVTDDGRPPMFVGTTLERIGLTGVTLPPDARLDFRGAMVKSDTDLRDVMFDGALRLDRISVGGVVCMQCFDATRAVSCRHLQVSSHWVLCETELSERFDVTGFDAGSVVATKVRFEGGATLKKGVIGDDVLLVKSRFDGLAWSSHTRLGNHLDLGDAAFDHRLSLTRCRIRTGVMAASATVEDGLSLEHVVVDGELNTTRLAVGDGIDATTAALGGQVDCVGLTARDGPIDFTHSALDGPVYFDNATAEGRALRSRNARLGSGPAPFVRATTDGEFSPSDVACSTDSPARLIEATVDGSVICDRAHFSDELFCSSARVGRDIDFSDYTIEALTFGVETGGRLDFTYAYVTDAATFGDTVVHDPA